MYLKKLFTFFIMFLWSINSYALTPVSLQLQWKHQFEFAGFYMAKEKGFYKDVELDVNIKEYTDISDIIKKVDEKEVDFGIQPAALILEKNREIQLLSAIFQSSPFVLHSLKRDDIKTLKDIKNKTISFSASLNDIASIKAMLKVNGISESSFQQKDYSSKYTDLIEGKTDLTSSYISNEPFILKEMGIESTIFDPKDYGFDFYDNILFTSASLVEKNPKLVEDFRVASLKGWEYAFNHIDETINVILKKYNTQNKSSKALKYEANVLKKLALKPGVELGNIDFVRLREISNTYKLLELKPNSNEKLLSMIYLPPQKKQTTLTKEEKLYLKNRKPIKMCVDPDWMPYEQIKYGKHIGMSSDYFKHIRSFVKKPIELVITKSWQESLEFGKKRKCDIFSLAVKSPSRDKFLNFTDSYFSFPMMIATTMDKSYVRSIESIKDKKIAIVKGYAFIELLYQDFPNLNIIEVDNPTHGLSLVKSGKIFCYLDTLPTLNYEIQRNYIDTLKINGHFKYKWKLNIGVRNDDLILYNIFQKAVKNVDERVIQNIYDKWLHVEHEHEYDFERLLKWLAVFSIVLLFIGYKYFVSEKHNKELKNLQLQLKELNKTLEKKVQIQVQEISQKDKMLLNQGKLAAMGEMISAIAHQWRQPLNALSINIQNLDDDLEYGVIDKKFIDNFIEKNSKTIQFMSHTIDDFRNFYAIDKVKKNFSILKAIKETISLQSTYLTYYDIDVNLTGDDFSVEGFENEFKQVILNIISNAKDMIEDKKIEDGKIEIYLEKNSVKIKDNGGGIKEDLIDRIFEPYFTTKETGKGTGMGLYMSKMIIEEHMCGDLSVKNIKDGAEFIISF